MDKEAKKELYEAYLNGRSRTVEAQVTNGPKLSFQRSWDYKSSMKEITFKSLSKPDTVGNSSLKVEEVSLMPVANLTYYQITITR